MCRDGHQDHAEEPQARNVSTRGRFASQMARQDQVAQYQHRVVLSHVSRRLSESVVTATRLTNKKKNGTRHRPRAEAFLSFTVRLHHNGGCSGEGGVFTVGFAIELFGSKAVTALATHEEVDGFVQRVGAEFGPHDRQEQELGVRGFDQ